MKQQTTTIYLTNTYDVIGDGWLNVIKVKDINKRLILMQDDESIYYFEPMYINDKSSMVYDYMILYKTNINEFNEKISSDNIDQLTNYDLKTQYDILKWLIYLIDNGDWSRHDDSKIRSLDIELLIKTFVDIVIKYNKINKLNKGEEYYINYEKLHLRWYTYYLYSFYKIEIGVNTTNNPYVVLYHNDYSKDMVFVNINDLKQIYWIKNDVFNEFYFQKISKFNYTKYHSSYLDENLMLSIFDKIVLNQENNELKIYEINDKNEWDLTNDVDYLRFSIDQYIENIPYDSKNGEKFWKLRDKLDKRR